jgi:hypothetical protein
LSGKKERRKRRSRRKYAIVRRWENVKRPRPVKPIERGRGRGLAGPRQLGRMPSWQGNTSVVLSRPRVLAELYQSDFMTSSTWLLGLYNFNRTVLECVLSVTCVSLQWLQYAESLCFLRVTNTFPSHGSTGPQSGSVLVLGCVFSESLLRFSSHWSKGPPPNHPLSSAYM